MICKLDIEEAYDQVIGASKFNFSKVQFWGEMLWLNHQIVPHGLLQQYSRHLSRGTLIPVTLCYCYEAEYDDFCQGAQGLLSGFSIGVRNGTGLSIYHFLFANDTAVFCKANHDNLSYQHCLHQWLEQFLI